jgi:hypothetical protein
MQVPDSSGAQAPGGSHQPSGRVPDFFIVGQPKCGTTALHAILDQHPGIFMSDVKEPQFFATDVRPGVSRPSRWLPQTFEEYVSLYSDAAAGQLVGDASTMYIYSRTAAGLIAQERPDARIVVLLREPASFIRSLHLQLVANRVEDQSLRRALELEDARRGGESLPEYVRSQPMTSASSSRSVSPRMVLYRQRANYLEQIQRYHAVFPREQVLVLVYEEFRRDNLATVRRILDFLDLPADVELHAVEANPTLGRRVGIDRRLLALAFGRGRGAAAAKRVIKALVPQAARRATYRRVEKMTAARPAPPDEELMLDLRRSFEPDVRALSAYLDRDLVSLWGYDELS